MRLRRDLRDDRGVVGGVEAIPFGLLVFVVGALIAASAWAVIDAKMGTTAAARETARFLVESEGDVAGATAVGVQAFHNQVGGAGALEGPHIALPDGFRRCSRVIVTYRYRTPAVSIPLVGGFGSGITVSSSHSEVVDPFRAGLGEESRC